MIMVGLSLLILPFASAKPVLNVGTHSTDFQNSDFDDYRNALLDNFETTFTSIGTLSAQNLAGINMLTIDLTNFQSSSEQTAMVNFVNSGGTLVMNAFSNTCCNIDFPSNANTLLNPFGLEGINGGFTAATHSVNFVDNEIVNGPFGLVSTYTNQFESEFRPQAGNTFAGLGVDVLVGDSNSAFLAYLGPDPSSQRLGQVFIHTNYHAFGDSDAFSATGNFNDADNRALLLNVAASAATVAVPETSTVFFMLIGISAVVMLRKNK